ncbi:TetR/AcrR family transcriptional regulator [Nocardia cyriacigeorgica]|uniref:TetR/AcrR family transcriptional regulator n=1 Tax=Nocardia cyriacigeorgica TaxID=135487 RepID=UPI002454661C|nr:TetR/AcrR family transcriptional regulator [Nocardia cyriacigeorgica]
MSRGLSTEPAQAGPDDTALPTDKRLIRAAERLFAERGIDAVSLRAVMSAAGANVASVHYHFGSKDALVEALLEQRGGQVSQRRSELLDHIEASGDATARSLAEAFVRPVAEQIAAGGTAWVTIVAGIIGSRHPALSRITEGFAPQARRFTSLLGAIYPDVPAHTIRFRLTQAMSLTFQALGDLDGLRDMLALSGTWLTPEEVLEELIDLVTAILAGPPDR